MKLRNYVNKPDGSATRQGLYVDDHIAGLLTTNDEIIALAMIPSDYELDGSMFELHQPFRVFNEQRLRQ